MRYKYTILGTFFLGLMILTGLTIVAQESKPYDRVGMLDSLNPDQGRVVIFDVLYNLHHSAKIYRFSPDVNNRKLMNHEIVSLKTLAPGMMLGYTVHYSDHTQPGSIKEIWILPSDNTATRHSEENEKER